MIFRGITIFSVIVFSWARPEGRDNDGARFTIYETPEKIISEGYVAEKHHVTTDDGYILEMHRIPFKRHQTSSNLYRPAILLMHGLYSASNAYIALGPDYSIAYNFADAGFDVFMGNARGNKLSRFHVNLDPDDEVDQFKFFDFTWEEIGMIDVAAMVDYILNLTGQTKLHYIGHSQGGTVFLVLASMRPEYNQKFTSVHLLAGVGYQEYFPEPQLRFLAGFSDLIYTTALSQNIVEMYPPGQNGTFDIADLLPGQMYNRADFCTGNLKTKNICDLVGIRSLLRETEDGEIDTIIDLVSDIGGGSLKQMAHYGQNIRDRMFRRWNYGSQNMEIYGSMLPPQYNLSLITADVTMHYTISDNLLDERDVLAMVADMPNTKARKVARDSFLHEDFAVALDAKELVTDYIIESMLNLEQQETGYSPDSASIATMNFMFMLYLLSFNLMIR